MKFGRKIHFHDKKRCGKNLRKGTLCVKVISKKLPWWHKKIKVFSRKVNGCRLSVQI